MTGQARGKILVYAVALFIAGGISGAVATYHKVETQPLRVNRKGEITEHILTRLKTTLALTPEQEKRFQPMIEATAAELEASHLDCLNRVSTALDKLHGLISPELSADQQEKLKQLETERRQLMMQKYNYAPTNSSAHR
jgi:hypothetical protein